MNSNMSILIIVFAIIALLSIVWNVIFTFYSNKRGITRSNKANVENNNTKSNKLLSAIKPDISWSDFSAVCPILLPNTDEDIAEALKHIEPSSCAKELLESLYEQTRI